MTKFVQRNASFYENGAKQFFCPRLRFKSGNTTERRLSCLHV